MRKIELRMNEEKKYFEIKKLIDNKGNKLRTASILNVSLRTIDRLIKKYKEEGKNGFIHKNRNRKPATTIKKEIKDKIIELYTNKFYGLISNTLMKF